MRHLAVCSMSQPSVAVVHKQRDCPMSSQIPRVALLVETSKSYGRGVLRGIDRYVKEHDAWSFYLEPRDLGTMPPPWLLDWDGDGIIARISDKKIATVIQNVNLPTVNLSSALPDLGIPCIETNPRSVARLATQHMLERGFRSFGFCGDDGPFLNWSIQTCDGVH